MDDFLNHGGFRVETSFLSVLESSSAQRREDLNEEGGPAGVLDKVRVTLAAAAEGQGGTYMTWVWVQ
jgi:hypothetical protein